MRAQQDEPDVRAACADLTDGTVRTLRALHQTFTHVTQRCAVYFLERPLRVLRGGSIGLESLAAPCRVRVEIVDSPGELTPVDRMFAQLRADARLTETPSDAQVRAYWDAAACADARIDEEAQTYVSSARIEQQVLHAGNPSGVPLLVLNAMGQPVRLWRWVLLHLRATHRILLWSPRAPNAGPDHPLDLDAQLDDIVRELDAAGIGQCHLLAWCTGAKTALLLHARAPGRFLTTTLLSGAYKHWPEQGSHDTSWEARTERLARRVHETPRLAAQVAAVMPEMLRAAVLDVTRFEDEETLGKAVLERPPTALHADLPLPFETAHSTLRYCRQLLDLWERDLSPGIRAASGRFALLSGAHDAVASPALSDRLATLLGEPQPGGLPRTATHDVFPGTGHYALVERHEELTRRILAHTGAGV